jgi:hypothetical protein
VLHLVAAIALFVALPALSSAQSAATRAPVNVQLGTAVQPETVTVGQHFTATIRVRVPTGAQLRFPAHPDSAARVDTAAPVARTDAHAATYDESTVRYVLAAWDTGAQAIGIDDVVVATPSGTRIVPLEGLKVFVRSVLPADTSKRVPKPPRDPVSVSVFNWIPWAIAAAILALIALIAWIVWRWRRRTRAPLTPYAWAQRELQRIAQSGWETSDPVRYGVAVTDVLRGYLARSFPVARLSETTRELSTSLAGVSAVPQERAIPLLDAIDLVKFARRTMATDDARAAGTTVREIIDETERRLTAERAAAEQTRKAA